MSRPSKFFYWFSFLLYRGEENEAVISYVFCFSEGILHHTPKLFQQLFFIYERGKFAFENSTAFRSNV